MEEIDVILSLKKKKEKLREHKKIELEVYPKEMNYNNKQKKYQKTQKSSIEVIEGLRQDYKK